MDGTYHQVVKSDEIEDRAAKPFLVNKWPIAICRDGGKLHAFINRCSHAAAAFAPDCRIRKGSVMCPLHGARFMLATGQNVGGTNYDPLKLFDIRETDDGWIEVCVPDEEPSAEHTPVTAL